MTRRDINWMRALASLTIIFVAGMESDRPPRATIQQIEAAHRPRPHRGPDSGRIATNTQAFDEYAFNLMLEQAERLRQAWRLARVPRLGVTNVTWDAVPEKDGVDGGIVVGDAGRSFAWGFWRGALFYYTDEQNQTQRFEYHDDESLRLSKIKSRITAAQAEKMARDYLHAIEMIEKTNLGLIEPPMVEQFKFGLPNGTVSLLPVFRVEWRLPGYGPAFDSNGGFHPAPGASFDISGVTAEVEHCDITALAPKPLPTNYLDMLEILPPTNMEQRIGLKLWPHK
jgi:hypothetical protein